MFKYKIRSVLRQMRQNPFFTSLNVLGFTIGLAGAFIILLWVWDEIHYDTHFFRASSIYRVVALEEHNGEISKKTTVSRGKATELIDHFPQIEMVVSIGYWNHHPLEVNERRQEVIPAIVSHNFFEIFDFPFIEGHPMRALEKMNGLVISETVAHRLFGNEPALGKTVVDPSFYPNDIFEVTGVIHIPSNTHFSFDVLIPEGRFLSNSKERVYLRLKEGVELEPETRQAMATFLYDQNGKGPLLSFQPLTDIHLFSDFFDYRNANPGNVKYVWVFIMLALLILVMAVLNFSVLESARGASRFGEMGIRKVYGASRSNLASMILGETGIQALGALLLTLVVVSLTLPIMNSWWGKVLEFQPFFLLLGIMLFLVLLTTFMAGYGPSVFLSGCSPIKAFNIGAQRGTRRGWMPFLVVGQFTMAILLMGLALLISNQMAFVRDFDLGMAKENIVVIPTNLWYSSDAYIREIKEHPNVISASSTVRSPAEFYWKNEKVTWEGKQGDEPIEMVEAYVDGFFQETFDLELLQGEFLSHSVSQHFSKDYGGMAFPYVVNEAALKRMGITDPIGKRINNSGVIVGVVKDFHFRSLQEEIAPLLLSYNPESQLVLNVRISGNDVAGTLDFLRKTYEKHRPNRYFNYQFFDDILAKNYEKEILQGQLVQAFAILALIISALGIWSMTAFSMRNRAKELAIRKINGANWWNLLLMVNKDYLKWVFLALFLALVPGLWLANRWLQGFAYHVDLSPWFLVAGGVGALVVACMIVSLQSWRYVQSNPVESLRYE